jgi:hypothetical protein
MSIFYGFAHVRSGRVKAQLIGVSLTHESAVLGLAVIPVAADVVRL